MQKTEETMSSDEVSNAIAVSSNLATETSAEGTQGAASLPNGATLTGGEKEDGDIPDLDEACIAVKDIKEMDEDERAMMLRKRNAIYSKRKYYKKKKEVSRLESTKYELETENQRLKAEHRRLENLLLDAKRKMEVMKAVAPSSYGGLTSGLLNPFTSQTVTPFGFDHPALRSSGMGTMDPIMQEAYLRNAMLHPSQHHQQARQLEIQQALMLQQERERIAMSGMFGTQFQGSMGMGGAGIPMQHPQLMELNYPPGLSNMARGLPEEEAKFPSPPPPQPSIPEDVNSSEGLLQYLLMQRSQSNQHHPQFQQHDGDNI